MKTFQLISLIAIMAFATVNSFATQKEEVQSVVAQLKEALQKVSGVQTVTVGNVIVIEGEITEVSEMARIARLAEAMKDLAGPNGKIIVRNMTTISQKARLALAERITQQINTPEVKAQFINDTLFLEGMADSEYHADRIVEIAKAFFRTSDNGWTTVAVRQTEQREPTKTENAVSVKINTQEAGGDASPIWGRVTIVDVMKVKAKPTINRLAKD